MNDQKRRTFRPRNQRSGFRPRNNNGQNSNGHFKSNGNGSIGGNNGSMTNPFNVEKTAQKYEQLAKDSLTSGDPVLHENYLQHAEHCFRQLDVTVKETNTNTEDLPKTIVSKKIIKKSTIEKKTDIESVQEKSKAKTDFDDFANQLA